MKKVLFKIGLVLLFAAMLVSCGGNGGNPDSENEINPISIDSSDITTITSEVTLTDGTWKFIEDNVNEIESGIFTISESKSKITYTELYRYSNGQLHTIEVTQLNKLNNVTRFDGYSPENWELKTNNTNKFSIYKVNTRKILLEKIE